MRRLLLPIVIIFLVVFVLILKPFKSYRVSSQFIAPTPTATPTPTLPPISQVELKDATYSYLMIRVKDPLKITLIPNFSDKRSSAELMASNSCTMAINGSYYDTDNKPLGLLIAGGKTYGNQITSSLMDGIIWIGNDKLMGIDDRIPGKPISLALQTGPRLFAGGLPRKLTIRNDEQARRMMAVLTKDQEMIFMVVFDEVSRFSGPLLGDLPTVLESIRQKENLTITDAINLDGGSASAFVMPGIALREITPIGSLFCIRQ